MQVEKRSQWILQCVVVAARLLARSKNPGKRSGDVGLEDRLEGRGRRAFWFRVRRE
jgi:hypothetical protein